MINADDIELRQATSEDGLALAQLIDIAGEGVPTWLWQRACADSQRPIDIGIERARRREGGFSYTNATLAVSGDTICGMVLAYPITEMPGDDIDGLPAPIRPFVDLEKHAVGSWYINALAVFPAYQGLGIGTRLLAHAEKTACDGGYHEMTIQVYEQNYGAVRLYKSFGCSEKTTSPVIEHPRQPYYTGDVLLLTKPL